MTALLLAAGTGSRMGPEPKLTLPFGTSTVVGETARALVRAGVFARVVVVTGHAAGSVEAAALRALGSALASETGHVPTTTPSGREDVTARWSGPLSVVVVHNAAFADGMSGSVAVGAQAAPDDEPVAVMLGDLPLVRPETIRRLADALGGPADVVRPAYRGGPGHPVLFGADHLPALRALAPRSGFTRGDAGARVLARSARRVDVDDAGVVTDLDTRAAYAAARRARPAAPGTSSTGRSPTA